MLGEKNSYSKSIVKEILKNTLNYSANMKISVKLTFILKIQKLVRRSRIILALFLKNYLSLSMSKNLLFQDNLLFVILNKQTWLWNKLNILTFVDFPSNH